MYYILTMYIVYQVEANASVNIMNTTNVTLNTWRMFRKIIYNKNIIIEPIEIQYNISLIWNNNNCFSSKLLSIF